MNLSSWEQSNQHTIYLDFGLWVCNATIAHLLHLDKSHSSCFSFTTVSVLMC